MGDLPPWSKAINNLKQTKMENGTVKKNDEKTSKAKSDLVTSSTPKPKSEPVVPTSEPPTKKRRGRPKLSETKTKPSLTARKQQQQQQQLVEPTAVTSNNQPVPTSKPVVPTVLKKRVKLHQFQVGAGSSFGMDVKPLFQVTVFEDGSLKGSEFSSS